MSILAESSATVIPSGTWSIDPVWSALELEVKKLGLATVKGRALGFSGTIEGGETRAVGAVQVTVINPYGVSTTSGASQYTYQAASPTVTGTSWT